MRACGEWRCRLLVWQKVKCANPNSIANSNTNPIPNTNPNLIPNHYPTNPKLQAPIPTGPHFTICPNIEDLSTTICNNLQDRRHNDLNEMKMLLNDTIYFSAIYAAVVCLSLYVCICHVIRRYSIKTAKSRIMQTTQTFSGLTPWFSDCFWYFWDFLFLSLVPPIIFLVMARCCKLSWLSDFEHTINISLSYRDAVAQGLDFSGAKDLSKIRTRSLSTWVAIAGEIG